jgi:NAD-dependent SIR2 family protein deacetylase
MSLRARWVSASDLGRCGTEPLGDGWFERSEPLVEALDPFAVRCHALTVNSLACADVAPLERLAALLTSYRCVVLTGAGCSTESGIPDYRGAGRPVRVSVPIQHQEFVSKAEARRRYWARATIGWDRFSRAQPNAAHVALAQLERAGMVTGIITQNVDRLHQRAGSWRVVELHGALADVVCLDCGVVESRARVQERLLAANPGWLDVATELAPDGDAELPVSLVERFAVVACPHCDGVLKPDVVFFGGNVARPTAERAWSLFGEAQALLVVGSSLTVYSGYRFARRAAELGIPLAVINLGPTRADALPIHTRVGARAGDTLSRLAAHLVDARRQHNATTMQRVGRP